MEQQPEATQNPEDQQKKKKIFNALVIGVGSTMMMAVLGVGKAVYDAHDARLREVESKIGTPAQPAELTAATLKNEFVRQAIQQAFENNTPLVIDPADPALRQQLEGVVQETRAFEKRFNEGGKTLGEFGAAGFGVLAVSMIGYNAYKRRKKQQAADNSPNIG